MSGRRGIRTMIIGSCLAAACTDLSSPRADNLAKARTGSSPVTQSSFASIDDEFAAIAEAEPSFGGLFLDSTHAPVVLLTDTTRLAYAREAGVDASLSKRHISGGTIHVRRVSYDFKTLKSWYEREGAVGLTDLTFTDIDEQNNRLHFSVENANAQQQARTTLINLGIPAEAVLVDIAPAGSETSGALNSTIGDSVRPLRGGIAMRFHYYDAGTWVDTVCTLGLIVRDSNANHNSLRFLSVSHCGGQGIVNDTTYWQNTISGSGNLIARKTGDLAWSTYAYLSYRKWLPSIM
jgi:hypothetical protein